MTEDAENYAVTRVETDIEKSAMSTADLLGQVRLIQDVMTAVMKEGEHYGIIPGCEKPSLYQAGAEKLCMTFRLKPEFTIIKAVEEPNFIQYTVDCRLVHIPTGNIIGNCVASCNSRESKYRYRTTNTGRPVPPKYWDARDPKLLGGPQFSPRKIKGQWVIYERLEHDNPWDYQNTLLKMAQKRAFVGVTKGSTAASDIFTVDVEDMPGMHEEPPTEPTPRKTQEPPKKPPGRRPKRRICDCET